MGTNRATMIVRPPYLSKYAYVWSMYFFLKKRESGLLNTFGPTVRPMR